MEASPLQDDQTRARSDYDCIPFVLNGCDEAHYGAGLQRKEELFVVMRKGLHCGLQGTDAGGRHESEEGDGLWQHAAITYSNGLAFLPRLTRDRICVCEVAAPYHRQPRQPCQPGQPWRDWDRD